MILENLNFDKNSHNIVRMTIFLLGKNTKKKEMMKMYYVKPTLKNLSQGVRLKYIRRLRHMDEDDEYIEWKLNFKIENVIM